MVDSQTARFIVFRSKRYGTSVHRAISGAGAAWQWAEKERKGKGPRAWGSKTTAPRRKRRAAVVGDSLCRGQKDQLVLRIQGARSSYSGCHRKTCLSFRPLAFPACPWRHQQHCQGWTRADQRAVRKIQEFGAHLVFSSLLPVQAKGLGKDQHIMVTSTLLLLVH